MSEIVVTEFDRVPWEKEMRKLADALRTKGYVIREDETVRLEPVPAHLRNESGLPWFRIAVDSRSVAEDSLTSHLHGEG